MELRFETLPGISSVEKDVWNQLLGPYTSPFHRWEFLYALEESGSISPKAGWKPQHLLVWQADRLVAALIRYQKAHSHGEFVYDYMWADAAQRMGRRWYPKLAACLPATPSGDLEVLLASGLNESEVLQLKRAVLQFSAGEAREQGLRGFHLLFNVPDLDAAAEDLGMQRWNHHRYLWKRGTDTNFEAYLARFGKNQRRNIRREYASLAEQGVRLEVSRLSSLALEQRKDYAHHMWLLYEKTNDQFGPWAAKFLNERFFTLLFELAPDYISLSIARLGDSYGPESVLALAMLVHNERMLWGRYWGCYESRENLHFAVCYYAPIDWALREGFDAFDPGAGSPHKIRRGFVAVPCTSYHQLFDDQLDALMRHYLPQVNQAEAEEIEALNQESPLKNPS